MARDICIDGLFLMPEYKGTGTNRYLANLVRHISRIAAGTDGARLRVLLPSEDAARTFDPGEGNGLAAVHCRAMRLGKAWRLGLFLSMTEARNAAAVFLPSPIPVFRKPCRLAVTIHDIIPLLFTDQFRSVSGRLLRHSVRSSVANADLILTDSEYSKDDIGSHCGIRSERIVVAPLGFDSALFNSTPADANEAAGVLSRYGVTRPYVLHVGAIEPRKNLVRLVRAHRSLASRQRSFDFQLVLCGRLAFGCQELLELIGNPELTARVVLTGPVPDHDLATLYKSAVACAMPSLYEGFGLPLLEAMACGTPVISSNSSSLPEVGGDAPIYFDPESVEEMADSIERVVSDSVLREQMVERGLNRAQLFSWDDCARKTLAALRQL